MADILVPWLCLSLAGTMLAWTLASGPAELVDPGIGLAGYFAWSTPAALGAAVLCGALFGFGAAEWLARLSASSALAYVAVLKVLGVGLAPWAGLGLAVLGALALRRRIEISAALLLVHAMGTLTGLYLVYGLGRYLAAWLPFLDVLRAMWWLLRAAA